MSELDRLRLENEALRNVVQDFASVRSEHPRIDQLVRKARNVLQQVGAGRQQGGQQGFNLEFTSHSIATMCKHIGVTNPVVVLERLGPRWWEAYIDEKEDDFGVGKARDPQEALRHLYGRIRSFRQQTNERRSNGHQRMSTVGQVPVVYRTRGQRPVDDPKAVP